MNLIDPKKVSPQDLETETQYAYEIIEGRLQEHQRSRPLEPITAMTITCWLIEAVNGGRLYFQAMGPILREHRREIAEDLLRQGIRDSEVQKEAQVSRLSLLSIKKAIAKKERPEEPTPKKGKKKRRGRPPSGGRAT